jgi:hypothetical protein
MTGESAIVHLHVRQNNDVTVTAALTDPSLPLVGGKQQPLDLTGKVCHLVTKLSRDVPDSDPSYHSYTGTTLPPPTAGITQFAVPGTDLSTPAVTWWRVDVTASGKTVTAQFGPWEVEPV